MELLLLHVGSAALRCHSIHMYITGVYPGFSNGGGGGCKSTSQVRDTKSLMAGTPGLHKVWKLEGFRGSLHYHKLKKSINPI